VSLVLSARWCVLSAILARVFFELPHCSCSPNSSIQRRVPHAFHDRFAKSIYFLRVVRSKRGGDGRPVIHPAFELELSNHFGAIRLGPALRHLISANVRFVQIMHKVDGELDEKVTLRLVVVWIIQPFVKIMFGPKPKHRVRSILYPICLLPLFHDDRAKGYARQDISTLPHQIGLRQRGRSRGALPTCDFGTVGVSHAAVGTRTDREFSTLR